MSIWRKLFVVAYDMQFSDHVPFETGQFQPYGPYIALAHSDEQYRSKRGIFKLYQIVCIGQPS